VEPPKREPAPALAACSDAELLELTPETPAAFEVFYRRHVRGVLSYVAYRTGDTEVALDLTSEVFLAALVGRGRYRPEKGPGRAWLFGIANNKLAGERRRRVREHAVRPRLGIHWLEFSDAALDQAEDIIDASEAGFLSGLEDLPAAERAAVTARVLDARDYADIARTEQASEAAVRQRVSRGLARLRSRDRGPR
jgi:RNA polymerase sigma factor (sigma-70 family)